jgi:nucleotide-binding universal stress UspA family protein
MSETETVRGPYKMVVGIDFEKTGDDALADALRLAREHPNDELHLVHVVRVGKEKHTAEQLAEIERQMEESGEAMKARAMELSTELFPGEQWEQDMMFHVRLGEPAEALHQVAIDYDAHVIVVGTHARRGVEKLLLGSVAEHLVRISRVPVLIARERDLTGLQKSDQPDPAREGESVADSGYQVSERVTFGRRPSHISGLV